MKPTKEEILKKHHKNARGHWVALTSNRALKAMQEYAESYHKEKLKEIIGVQDELIGWFGTFGQYVPYVEDLQAKIIKLKQEAEIKSK